MSGLGYGEMSSCNFMLISPYKHHDQRLLNLLKPVQTLQRHGRSDVSPQTAAILSVCCPP